ncbi:photosynthetic reaction center cytochrome PufC [Sphingomonas sp.]|jgi:photosynthetic reaction center cytochrome c subunit|uniref:photosynthetic reaction center cytochrome PufC n=1 Tax=Sphingomonas sp. TaxID=28214 RepID=UPI002D7F7352|nr:photosynthetic reaction center cytochrome PufC [Sphingomonas sp.]HEU0045641.1 photosynthetic reaction center cytochrome PufC [Sphingomonas sp.]
MNRPVTTSVGAAALTLALTACEPGAKVSTQTGFRGTGVAQIVDRSSIAEATAIPAEAYPLPPDGGPTAAQTYQNVQVLGGVSAERFNHLMAQMNQWVVPADLPEAQQGCNYCHNPENMASDEKYTKVVARRMLQMTQAINSRWSSHVKQTGVTCYTCHRGNAVPANVWTASQAPDPTTIRGNKRGQNTPDANVGYASLPSDPFAAYFSGQGEIRVASSKIHPSADHIVSIKDAERTYGLMMHVSTALGVNCTYCHNSQSFRAWNLSSAQRGTAYYGIRMVSDANKNYITPLAAVFPVNRKGPNGDPYKINCTTCHQGLSKPLGGRSMIAQAPSLAAQPMTVAAPTGLPAAARQVPGAFNDPAAMVDKSGVPSVTTTQ